MEGRAESVEDLIDRLFRENSGWPEMVKAVRRAGEMDLDSAIALAFRHHGWRRWCNHRINHDAQCRKQALNHIRHGGALVMRRGDTLLIV